jgi:signal transduction histidine kinase
VLAAALLLSVAIALHMGRSITRPIRALVAGAEKVGSGDLGTRIRLDSRDEFAALAESFNRMTEELRDRQEELVRAGKLASLGHLAAGVAHQLNNPLAVILGYVRLLRDPETRGREDIDERLRIVEEEARECQGTVWSLLSLARPGALMPEEVDLRDLVSDALRHFQRYRVPRGVRVLLRMPAEPVVARTDRARLGQAVLNLLMNGAEAMPGGGALTVSCRRVGLNGATAAVLSVEDQGTGIPREALGRIFDPYFSTKRDGTGLGLTITHGIVKAIGGSIRVESEEGRGARFAILLPDRPAPSDGESVP